MKHFRGFQEEKTIFFDNKPFILLSAPNGIGKTTTIDAIEWCFTGNIGRLKKAYDNRSTNATERKKNLDGILKNKNAKSNDFVEVELTFVDQNESYTLLRKQKKDELNVICSDVMLNGSKELAQSWLKQNIGASFYNYHFCDIQKSFEMQNRKRDSLPEMFTEFISDYSEEKIVAENLEIYAEDVERYIIDLREQQVPSNIIDTYKMQIEKYKINANIIDYPQTIFFEDELVEIDKLNESQLNQQLQKLYTYGYNVAYSNLLRIIRDMAVRNTVSKLEEIEQLLSHKGNKINDAIKYGLDIGNEKIDELINRLSEYEKIELTKGNIRKYADKLIDFKEGDFTRKYYDDSIKTINEKELRIAELDKEIEHLTKGNHVLKLFTDLVSCKEVLVSFRDTNDKCPVCGSTQFSDIAESQILYEANEYIKKNNEIVLTKGAERKQLVVEVESVYEELILSSKKTLNKLIEVMNAQRCEYEDLKKETRAYFSVRNLLLNMQDVDFTNEQLNSLEFVKTKLTDIKSSYISDDEKEKCRKAYKKILTLMGYKFEDEEESTTAERIKPYFKDGINVENYTYSVFVQKINAVKTILDNKEYLTINEKLKNALETNARIIRECTVLENLKNKAEERSKKIHQLVIRLEQEEYAAVGPNLKKYYKKLARIDAIDTIDIILEDSQISMVDEKKKNIVNILSNGQLSVFMLSYFFAGITSRSKTEKCKIYFIDDLTACMDDVNMLAFLDLLKYQMSAEEKNMEQIFFVTCDDRICRLLRYKLEGCNIEYCELNEEKFL